MNDAKKIKILLVDDDAPTRIMYADIFKESNFEVIEAEDGVEGLEKSAREAPDVIFTGIIMPKMDGFTMMESLKKNVVTANIPVIISSHMGREEDRQKANMLGARYFVVKGYTSPKEVVEKVKSLFVGEKNYDLELSGYSMDAQKLASDLGMSSSFKCTECGSSIVLRLTLKDQKSETFEARLVCSSCGWQAK